MRPLRDRNGDGRRSDLYSFFYPVYRHQGGQQPAVLVVDEDHSATSRGCCASSSTARCAWSRRPADVDSARRQLEAGQAEGIVVIRPIWADILRTWPSSKLVLLGNGFHKRAAASWVLGSVADALVRSGVMPWSARRLQRVHREPRRSRVQRPLAQHTQEGYGSTDRAGSDRRADRAPDAVDGHRRSAQRTPPSPLGRRLRFDLPTLAGMALGFGLIGLFGLF